MKSSRIVLIAGAAALALLIIFSLIYLKLSIGSDISYSRDADIELSGETVDKAVDTSGISEISLEGVWKIDFSHSTESEGTLTVPVEYSDNVVVSRRGRLLTIGLGKEQSSTPLGGFSIVLPLASLEKLNIDGAVDGVLQDFEAESLDFRLHGAVNLTGRGLKAAKFSVISDGASNLNLSSSLFRDVQLEMKGASNVELKLDGGILKGKIEGIGSVTYTGRGENRLKSEGLINISGD